MEGSTEYDVIVVGSGHAGVEAALAAARMGCRTAVFTLNLDTVALMPCNPSIGGPGKGHLVREIDALGGEMGRNADRTSVQIRMLNTSKGPAVQALRVQSDKRAYAQSMKFVLEEEPRLDIKQAAVDDLLVDIDDGTPTARGVITNAGHTYRARTVVLTTGTFLKGRIIVGDDNKPGGRAGEPPADKLSLSLAAAGFRLGRLKTGTPPRVDGKTIDYALTELQPGSDRPLFFSYDARRAWQAGRMAAPSRLVPIAQLGSEPLPNPGGWRDQLACFGVETNPETHDIIRSNLDRAPMFNGGITSTGPRYCPSIETKIVRFAEKDSHHLFLEPEGWYTREMYVQGANTSLPEDVQLAMLRSVPALRNAEIMRAGYAIEYDYIPGVQVHPWLESKPMKALFLAGQIIGTTGYEEAAALGIMAGINAARHARQQDPVVLRRDQAYIGVLVDDLVTKEMDEPYRMHTSQAEFRLLLRQENADERLTPLAHRLGLVDDVRAEDVRQQVSRVESMVASLATYTVPASPEVNSVLERAGHARLERATRARDLLCRGSVHIDILQSLGVVADDLTSQEAIEVETIVKYAGYVARQSTEVARLHRLEDRTIPPYVEYEKIEGMRSESREKLEKIRPRTVGQAARIAGVAPSDISVLLVHLERDSRRAELH